MITTAKIKPTIGSHTGEVRIAIMISNSQLVVLSGFAFSTIICGAAGRGLRSVPGLNGLPSCIGGGGGGGVVIGITSRYVDVDGETYAFAKFVLSGTP